MHAAGLCGAVCFHLLDGSYLLIFRVRLAIAVAEGHCER